ncbi:hypothetical protein UXU46_01900 [Campylobacter jejuni]
MLSHLKNKHPEHLDKIVDILKEISIGIKKSKRIKAIPEILIGHAQSLNSV